MIWHGLLKQYTIQNMNSVIHHLRHTPIPTRFSTEVASSASHYNKYIQANMPIGSVPILNILLNHMTALVL